MSGPGFNFTDAPQSEVVASGAAVNRAQAPRTNGAMQLAAALQDLNPQITRLGIAISAEDKQVQSAAAKKRALELGGKSLADATRSGEISPTQNPYFIEDYNKESAYVRANSAVSALAVDSQSWAEKNNPQAFQARYSKELASIGEKFGGDADTMAGFNAAAAPAQQQAFAANTAEVGANILKDRDANLSQLITENITGTQKHFAGGASPDQLLTGLTDLKDHYISTGGTDQGWNKLVYHAYTTAAYNQGDPTLLDKLPANIRDLPGIADQISTDQYHIMQAKDFALRQQAQNIRDKTTLEGQQIFSAAYAKYGAQLMNGGVNLDQLAADNPGANPLSLASALNTVQAATADNQSLAIAKTRSLEQTPNGAGYILDLHTEAKTKGFSEDLYNKVGSLVVNRQIPLTDGNSILDQALETTKTLNSGGFLSKDPGKGIRMAQQMTANRAKPYDDLRRATDAEAMQMVGWVNKSARAAGNPLVPPAALHALQTQMAQAAAQYLSLHPGDFPGARKAAQQANGEWFAANAESYTKPREKAAK